MPPRFPIDGIVYRPPSQAEAFYESGSWYRGTAGDLLRGAGAVVPGKAAVIDESGTLTFGELDRRSESLAACLLEAGLRPGDRALFQIGSGGETFVALYGCFKAGILPVCSLPQFRELEIGQLAGKTNPKAYFVQADVHPTFDQLAFARRMLAAQPGISHLVVINGVAAENEYALAEMSERHAAEEARAIVAPWDPSPDDLLQLQLSGGSTGLPKVIPKFHGEYLGSVEALSRRFGLGEDDVTLWALPLIHNAGMLYVVVPTVMFRRTAVIQSRFDIGRFLEAIGTYRVTFTGSIGPIASRILEVTDIGRYDLSSLKQFFALAQADAVQKHTGIPASNMFGITEGMYCVSSLQCPAQARHNTVGYPIEEQNTIRLASPETGSEVPLGEVGELTFSGPHIFSGYYNDPEVNAASFSPDGFFRTGDLMRAVLIDGKARYVFEGRLKDNINRGGEKFGAEEVEQFIVRHPAIADARVVAMPDKHYGEKACAFLIPLPGKVPPDLAELGTFLLTFGLAKYKLPERLVTIAEWPLTRVGKVDKAALRAEIAHMLIDEQRSEGEPQHAR
jgi:non-ribosomal peptide synthetase component E (peptide arylation enzyme)